MVFFLLLQWIFFRFIAHSYICFVYLVRIEAYVTNRIDRWIGITVPNVFNTVLTIFFSCFSIWIQLIRTEIKLMNIAIFRPRSRNPYGIWRTRTFSHMTMTNEEKDRWMRTMSIIYVQHRVWKLWIKLTDNTSLLV